MQSACASLTHASASQQCRTSVARWPLPRPRYLVPINATSSRDKWRPNRDLVIAGDSWAAHGRGAITHADDMDTVWPRHIGSTRSDICHCRCYVSSPLPFKSQAVSLCS
ncbi:unnamed protein product, partial [Brenthis ino]